MPRKASLCRGEAAYKQLAEDGFAGFAVIGTMLEKTGDFYIQAPVVSIYLGTDLVAQWSDPIAQLVHVRLGVNTTATLIIPVQGYIYTAVPPTGINGNQITSSNNDNPMRGGSMSAVLQNVSQPINWFSNPWPWWYNEGSMLISGRTVTPAPSAPFLPNARMFGQGFTTSTPLAAFTLQMDNAGWGTLNADKNHVTNAGGALSNYDALVAYLPTDDFTQALYFHAMVTNGTLQGPMRIWIVFTEIPQFGAVNKFAHITAAGAAHPVPIDSLKTVWTSIPWDNQNPPNAWFAIYGHFYAPNWNPAATSNVVFTVWYDYRSGGTVGGTFALGYARQSRVIGAIPQTVISMG